MHRVAEAIATPQTRVLDVDLRAFFDNVPPPVVWAQVAQRGDDADVLPGRTLIRQASGQHGVPPGGGISPWLRHLSLNEVDRRLARAQEVTRHGTDTSLEDARLADALVSWVEASPPQDWRLKAMDKRRREACATLHVEIHDEKSRVVDLAQGERGGCWGVDCHRVRRRTGAWRPHDTPQLTKRTALLRQLKDLFRRFPSPPVDRVVDLIHPIRRGWVQDWAVGHASQCFADGRDWGEKTVRRPRMRARTRRGFGWLRWRRRWLDDGLGLCNGDRVRRLLLAPTARPTREVSSPVGRSEQESGVRDIRTRRLTRRGLDTWPWGNGAPHWPSNAPAWKPFTDRARASSRPYLKQRRGE